MRNELAFFVMNCTHFEMQELYSEMKRMKRKMRGDSVEYKLLESWVKGLRPQQFYLTVEVGVREGYGTLVITDALKDKNYFHVGIDPYGDLLYKHLDKQIDRENGTIAYWTDFEGRPLINEDGTPKVPTYPNSMKQTFLSQFKNHEILFCIN